MIDLRAHRERCDHAEGSLTDVAGWSMARGIAVPGVSDHAPRFPDSVDQPRPSSQMALSAWDGYLAAATTLRAELAGRLDPRGGVEENSLPGTEADNLHARYWRSVAAAAASGRFDVLAHPDVVRMLASPAEAPRAAALGAAVADVFNAIADAGVAVEINGSGVRCDGRAYPEALLLAEVVCRGVPISYGSDAHRREQLGQGWDEARALLATLGVTRVVESWGRWLGWLGG